MRFYAISDLHLSFGTDKPMDIFGPEWEGHAERLRESWESLVRPEDIVLLPGDHSWAMRVSQAMPDLGFIARLPGTKIMVRGNHDYWWKRQGTGALRKIVDPSIVLLHRTSASYGPVGIAGTRGWRMEDGDGSEADSGSDERILARELGYLRESLAQIADAEVKMAMLHYPPFTAELEPTEFAAVLEEHGVDVLVYGHVHSGGWLEGNVRGTEYHLVAADHLKFTPKLVCES